VKFQGFILLLNIPAGTRKNFFEFNEQFGQAFSNVPLSFALHHYVMPINMSGIQQRMRNT
jgi:hypothetical protein